LELGDFRPISLLNSLSKIIAKVLIARLASVIDTLIDPNQAAFIKVRNILDSVASAQEIVHACDISHWLAMLFKLDFKKAFDTIDWTFLL